MHKQLWVNKTATRREDAQTYSQPRLELARLRTLGQRIDILHFARCIEPHDILEHVPNAVRLHDLVRGV